MFSSSSAASAVVLLASFSDNIAAHLAKNQLEAAGIPCFLGNENRPYGAVLGAVRLFVRASDVAAAREALQPQQAVMHALTDELETSAVPRCPRCHHTDVVCRHQPQPSDNLFVKLRLWLLASGRPQCHCFQCGFDFEAD